MSTYIIAELGLNHNGDLKLCRDMIDAAAACGVDAVKFQLISKKANYNLPPDSPLFPSIEKCDLGVDGYGEMAEYGRKYGLEIVSSVADLPSIDVFKAISCNRVKISSSNFSNRPLCAEVCNLKLPVILSSGSSDLVQIIKTITYMKSMPDVKLSLLHCISQYPTNYADCHLRVIPFLKELLHIPVGFSDHTLSVEIGAIAVALGATILEKHLTMDRRLSGPDHSASLMPSEMSAFVRNVREAETMLGNPDDYFFGEARKDNPAIKRNIVCRDALPKHSVLQATDLIVARPGKTAGIPVPIEMMDILPGKKLHRTISKWESICWTHILDEADDSI